MLPDLAEKRLDYLCIYLYFMVSLTLKRPFLKWINFCKLARVTSRVYPEIVVVYGGKKLRFKKGNVLLLLRVHAHARAAENHD